MFKNLKLRTRLTLSMALILFGACSVLTFASILSADKIYQPLTARPSPVSENHTAVGTPLPPVESTHAAKNSSNHAFQIASLISIVLVFITGTGATYAIAGKALRPVTQLSRDIETIDENNLFRTVCESTSGDEVSKLSASFNNMIGKLEKAFTAQKNFSANAAHELKTPLAAIIARIEVCQLDETPPPQEYKETLDDVLQSAERLSALVHDLLEMNAEPYIEKRETIDAAILFAQIIEDVSPNNPKQIHFDNQVDGIHLFGDRRLLYRAFLNIVQNAVKYNKPNGSVTISAKRTLHQAIAVSDTGCGIPADQLDKIFDPFYCVDKSRSRQLGGSGLGLSLVKTIIEKHGGSIQAESEMDTRTTITVTLP